MKIKLRIHKLHEVVERQKLLPHARLVTEEVAFLQYVSYIPPLGAQTRQIYHTVHKSDKTPKCGSVILHHSIDRGKEIAHALNIAKVLVVFIVC